MNMKKNFMMYATAALMLAGCAKEDNIDNWNGEIRLTSSLTVLQNNTRAASDIQNDQFLSGESIDVFISEATPQGEFDPTSYEQPLTYTTGGSGVLNAPQNKQPYFPASGNGVSIYAIYPTGQGQAISFTVQTDQREATNYKASDLMYASESYVARSSQAVKLEFKHLLSKVIITLVQGHGSPDLDGATVTLQDVYPTINFTPETGTIGGTASGTKTPIKVMEVSNGILSGSAIVVPQTLATSFIKVTLKNGGELISNELMSADGNLIPSVLFTSGKEYKYEITVNLTSLGVTSSSITAWGPGTGGNGTAEML